MPMSVRDRFVATALFEPIDRPYRMETTGFWDETMERWQTEGLPPEMANEAGCFILSKFDMLSYVEMGSWEHPGFYPTFEEEIIEEDEHHIKKRDPSGCVVLVKRDGKSTIPQFLEFPVKDRASWLEVKERLNPESAGRVDVHENLANLAIYLEWPMCVYITGLFGMHRQLFGFEPLMYAYFEQPDLIHEISRHWVCFWKSVLAQLCERHKPAYVELWEDMCGRNGPLISPDMFETFMSPYYKELVSFLRNDLDIPVVGVDTDGDMSLLIPKFVDTGINLLRPFEVQAGMDVLKVRREWPDQFCIHGGMDKRELAKGRSAIEAEVMRIVPEMVKHGGYIPGIDHGLPPDVPLNDWFYFCELTREVAREYSKKA